MSGVIVVLRPVEKWHGRPITGQLSPDWASCQPCHLSE